LLSCPLWAGDFLSAREPKGQTPFSKKTMPKIKCPHCGANNQDVTEKDRCWSCEAVLGDAPVPIAEPTPATPVAAQVQKQVEPTAPAPRPTDSSPQRRSIAAPIAIAVVVLLILIAIVLFMMKK